MNEEQIEAMMKEQEQRESRNSYADIGTDTFSEPIRYKGKRIIGNEKFKYFLLRMVLEELEVVNGKLDELLTREKEQ